MSVSFVSKKDFDKFYEEVIQRSWTINADAEWDYEIQHRCPHTRCFIDEVSYNIDKDIFKRMFGSFKISKVVVGDEVLCWRDPQKCQYIRRNRLLSFKPSIVNYWASQGRESFVMGDALIQVNKNWTGRRTAYEDIKFNGYECLIHEEEERGVWRQQHDAEQEEKITKKANDMNSLD
tara:strand:- start:73 stop:603 length:531 start_codon:yes stop_codon:yes gene_type:complete